MIAEDLIDRLASETRERLEDTGRKGRRRALSVIQECRILLTEDGNDTWEEVFDRPPTLAQLMARAGAGAFVVAVSMQQRTVRGRIGLRMAAE